VSTEVVSLQNLRDGRAALERARSLGEIKEIKRIGDLAAAAKRFAEAQGLSKEAKGYAAEMEIDAGRYLGEVLARQRKNRGGRPTKSSSPTAEVLPPPTVPELGLTHRQSSQAQKLAAIPEKKYQTIKERARRSDELSKSGVLRLAATANVERDKPHVVDNSGRVEWTTPPQGVKFGTAIIDPPWPYSAGPRKAGFATHGREKSGVYESLSLPEIKDLRVGDVVTGYVFLWVGKKFLRDSFDVLEAWGFIPRSWMVWVKTSGSGVGSWFKSDAELVILATKKDAPFLRTCASDVFSAPRTKHSAKPEYLHQFIEREHTYMRRVKAGPGRFVRQPVAVRFPGPYLELFGRSAREGWVVLGDEAPGDGKDIRESLALACPRSASLAERAVGDPTTV